MLFRSSWENVVSRFWSLPGLFLGACLWEVAIDSHFKYYPERDGSINGKKKKKKKNRREETTKHPLCAILGVTCFNVITLNLHENAMRQGRASHFNRW